jgi:hypothetical protein
VVNVKVNLTQEESIGEVKVWWQNVIKMDNILENVHSVLLICDEKVFPVVKKTSSNPCDFA